MRDYYKQHKEAVLGTIMVHMVIIILLLAFKVKTNYNEHYSDVTIDFQDLEVLEKIKEQKKDELEELLNQTKISAEEKIMNEIRSRSNKAVNEALSELDKQLDDGRHDSQDDLYKEAQDLQNKLNETEQRFKENREFGAEDTDVKTTEKPVDAVNAPKGTTNISYSLGKRKMTKKAVPVYKCQGGGEIVVNIKVNKMGYVVYASVDTQKSLSDDCLCSAATQAARITRFNSDAAATDDVVGTITYVFVAQ